MTSSVFAGGCTNTEGASAIFHKKGESKDILKEEKQLFKLKALLTKLVSLVDEETHH